MTNGFRRGAALAVALGAIVILPSCGDDDEPSTSEPPASDSGASLTIQNFTFSPLTVAAGAAFSIENLDGFAHTVTSDSFDVRVGGGTTETLTIDEPGTYDIHCEIHSSMQGTIVVD